MSDLIFRSSGQIHQITAKISSLLRFGGAWAQDRGNHGSSASKRSGHILSTDSADQLQAHRKRTADIPEVEVARVSIKKDEIKG